MGKINILTDDICNRIAAGEVIDRPYSVVKELVENSIDAGATEIEIHIERGGKDLIEVSDNGCGIEKEDVAAAFYPHATSKITTIDDIDHIHTLGFRGEALATIASIAKVELVSAVEGKDGNMVECDGEFIGKVKPAVSQKGTTVSVRNIFFNTPVRFKFMRSDKKEEGDITNFVTRFILGNPDISFRYYIDGKLSLQSYGGGVEEAIAQVYGANYLPNCFKISVIRNDLQISGFIGNQNFFKPNKTYQSIFLNGRYVINPIIASAITNAYAPYAMKRQYPFYVLKIQMPEDMVDVNVHPNKADVRFVNNALVYGTMYKVISSVLDGTAKAAEYVVEESRVPEIKSTYSEGDRKNHIYSESVELSEPVFDKDFSDVAGIEKYLKADKKAAQKQEEKPDYSYFDEFEPTQDALAGKQTPRNERGGEKFIFGDRANEGMYLYSGTRDYAIRAKIDEMEALKKAQQEKILFNSYKFRGTLFDTYLLYEICNDVYIIDQHAAHERLIYNDLCEKFAHRDLAKQGMLIPYMFEVNSEEQEFIENNMDTIWRMGFSVEPFGDHSYRVSDIPADLPQINIKQFFDEFLANVGEMKKIEITDILKEKIAQTACKHAIKGGDKLTDAEIEKLFAMLDGNLGLKCPHGRPICVKMSKTELEKMFKRKL